MHLSFLITPNGIVEENWKSSENEMRSGLTVNVHSPKMLEREFKRYGAYYKGWCQALGQHESLEADDRGSKWLFTNEEVGLLLPKSLLKLLYRETLSSLQVPPLVFGQHGVNIGKLNFLLKKNSETPVLTSMKKLLEAESDLHVFMSSHLLYGDENRIITFSKKKPLSLIYREIGNMRVRLADLDHAIENPSGFHIKAT